MKYSCRPARAEDAAPVSEFLRPGMPADAFLLDALDTGGAQGFHCAWDGDAIAGVAFQRRGAISASIGTTRLAAYALATSIGNRESWTSVVGPEDPCSAIVDSFRSPKPFRVDRVQSFMAIHRGDRLGPGNSGVRRATMRDLDTLVLLVARYRIEDGLSASGDDHGAWIRLHTMERIQTDNLFVVEEKGRIVFTGAFNFVGRWGAGIGGIYTVPEARGRGVASRATADLCRIALESGLAATLHVDPANEAAIRAYRKAGLSEAGEFRLTFR